MRRHHGSADTPTKWQVPRTADGQPDLQGAWNNSTITPLERPKEFGERLVISDAEAKTIEAQNQQFNEESDAPTDPTVKTQDLPPLLPERQKALTERYLMMRTNFDGPEARPLAERCLLAFGSSSGPPMLVSKGER